MRSWGWPRIRRRDGRWASAGANSLKASRASTCGANIWSCTSRCSASSDENRLRTPMSTSDIYPVLITRDAAATIERTLESLAAFPEVVVYDNGSTDATIELCGRFPNVRVVTGEFFGYGKTKNHAV